MKNYNKTLIEKQQKYQHYHQEKLINMNILQVRKYYVLPSPQSQILEQAKFTYCALRKSSKKQIKTIEYQKENKINSKSFKT